MERAEARAAEAVRDRHQHEQAVARYHRACRAEAEAQQREAAAMQQADAEARQAEAEAQRRADAEAYAAWAKSRVDEISTWKRWERQPLRTFLTGRRHTAVVHGRDRTPPVAKERRARDRTPGTPPAAAEGGAKRPKR